jgi:hypothetical protein
VILNWLKLLAVSLAGSMLSIAALASPTIATQPVSQNSLVGTNIFFSVVATGTTPLAYQWQKNGATIASGTLATLNLHDVQASDAGNYSVIVSDTASAITSSTATLTMTGIAQTASIATSYEATGGASTNATPAISGPTITTQPASQSYLVGTNAYFNRHSPSFRTTSGRRLRR